ncbi:MAG: hypothetical protein AAGJ39_08375 [Pseudomonadota bacterium]
MKQAFTLFFLFCGGLIAVDVVFGFGAAYAISYGAISLMGLMISGTFTGFGTNVRPRWPWACRFPGQGHRR